MWDWIAPSSGRPSVSLIYSRVNDQITKPLPITSIWSRELYDFNLSLDWERVWSNLALTSKNLAHRLIHYKVIHRAYITPYKRFKMKLQSTFNCHICNTLSSGTFLHMFWECPVVANMWDNVNLVLSSLLQIDYLPNPGLCLLNDDSDSCITLLQKRMLFAGFTAAKKTIIQNWFTPHMCAKTYWIHSLHKIVTCECTTARINKAKPSTVGAWQCFSSKILDYIKEWFYKDFLFYFAFYMYIYIYNFFVLCYVLCHTVHFLMCLLFSLPCLLLIYNKNRFCRCLFYLCF